jgi:hypothetical protein
MLPTGRHDFPINVYPVYDFHIGPFQDFAHGSTLTTSYNEYTISALRRHGGHDRMYKAFVVNVLV